MLRHVCNSPAITTFHHKTESSPIKGAAPSNLENNTTLYHECPFTKRQCMGKTFKDQRKWEKKQQERQSLKQLDELLLKKKKPLDKK